MIPPRIQSMYLWSSGQCCFEREFSVVTSPSFYVMRKLKGREGSEDVHGQGWREYRNIDDVHTQGTSSLKICHQFRSKSKLGQEKKELFWKRLLLRCRQWYWKNHITDHEIWHEETAMEVPRAQKKKTDKYFKWRKEVDDVECQYHSCL